MGGSKEGNDGRERKSKAWDKEQKKKSLGSSLTEANSFSYQYIEGHCSLSRIKTDLFIEFYLEVSSTY